MRNFQKNLKTGSKIWQNISRKFIFEIWIMKLYICIANSVYEIENSKVLVEFRVVKIMKMWFLESRKCVVRVHGQCAEVEEGDPAPNTQWVWAKQQRPCAYGHQVRDNILHGVGVGGRNRHWWRPLVVLFVEALEKTLLVHHSVNNKKF